MTKLYTFHLTIV